MSIDAVKIILISFYIMMILFISVMIMNTKNSPMFLGISVIVLIIYSYSLGNFQGRSKEIANCFHQKELLLNSETAWLKSVNKHIAYISKKQMYEYKGNNYILLDIIKLKPTNEGNNRGWVEAVVYAPTEGTFDVYVREKKDFDNKFKQVNIK